MDSSCVPQWHSTVSGVYPLLTNASSPSDTIHTKYCYGGTTMYMNGFVWEDTNCVIYLFRSWVITSRGFLVLACIGTVLLGILLESLVWVRRKYLLPKSSARHIAPHASVVRKIMIPVLCYGIQLLFGYLLMLIVMTYSGPLVISVIMGLVLGNVIFLWRDSFILNRGTSESTSIHSLSLVKEDDHRGFTPCCDNGI